MNPQEMTETQERKKKWREIARGQSAKETETEMRTRKQKQKKRERNETQKRENRTQI
jgi:hypothetical protein